MTDIRQQRHIRHQAASHRVDPTAGHSRADRSFALEESLIWGELMPEEITAARVETLAAAARVSLPEGSATRIANAIAPTIARLANAQLDLSLETEPSTFVVVQRREIDR